MRRRQVGDIAKPVRQFQAEPLFLAFAEDIFQATGFVVTVVSELSKIYGDLSIILVFYGIEVGTRNTFRLIGILLQSQGRRGIRGLLFFIEKNLEIRILKIEVPFRCTADDLNILTELLCLRLSSESSETKAPGP